MSDPSPETVARMQKALNGRHGIIHYGAKSIDSEAEACARVAESMRDEAVTRYETAIRFAERLVDACRPGGDPHEIMLAAMEAGTALAALAALGEVMSDPSRYEGLPTQAQTLAWVERRWPNRTSPIWRAAKLCEEAGEVMGAVIKTDEGRKTAADVELETAQVVICCMGVAESVGFDLFAAVAAEWKRCADYPLLPLRSELAGHPSTAVGDTPEPEER